MSRVKRIGVSVRGLTNQAAFFNKKGWFKKMKLADMMQLALKNGYSFEELKQLKEWEREELAKGSDEGEEKEGEGGDEPEKPKGDEQPDKNDSNSLEDNEQQKQIEELTKQVENLKNELKKAQDTNKRGSSESLETESAFERMMKKASR